jgi:hypothetical protein
MSAPMPDQPAPAEPMGAEFRPVRVVLVVFAALLLVSFASHWYAGEVSLPRYCQQPELALQRLAAVITENRPAGEEARLDYIVAAKLEFLVPPTADEPLDAYLQRVRRRLERQCG